MRKMLYVCDWCKAEEAAEEGGWPTGWKFCTAWADANEGEHLCLSCVNEAKSLRKKIFGKSEGRKGGKS